MSSIIKNNKILTKKIVFKKKKTNELLEMMSMVNTAKNILESKKIDIDDFGLLLHENWKIKKSHNLKCFRGFWAIFKQFLPIF